MALFAFTWCLAVGGCSPAADDASALGEIRRHHELIFQTASKYRAVTKKQVNTGEIMLHEIVFAENVGDEINGEIRIPLPKNIAAVWNDFRFLKLEGEFRSDYIDAGAEYGRKAPGKLQRQKGGRSCKFPIAGFHVPTDPGKDCVLILRGYGLLKSLSLESTGGINRRLDLSDYQSFEDHEAYRVGMTIDATCRRSIGGISKLDRNRYFNIHGAYGWGDRKVTDYIIEKNFSFGRSCLHMPVGVKGLKENKQRPGYADLSYFEDETAMAQGWLKDNLNSWSKFQAATYEKIQWPMYFHGCPEFMAVAGIRNKITPKDYDAMGELFVGVLSAYKRHGGTVPTWIEVLNESDIDGEWGWHWDRDAMAKNALYHNTVARHLHKRFPGIKVGGPTSAWPQFDHNGFSTAWRKHKEFIDITHDTLDFYSLHFYERPCAFSYESQFKNGVRVFSQGKLGACLDLFENYQMLVSNNIKPLVVSECGSTPIALDELGCWHHMRCLNTYLMYFFERPDRIHKITEFLIPYTPWNVNYTWALFRLPDARRKDCTGEKLGDYHKTYLTCFLDLWADLKGYRVKTVVDNSKVLVRAFAESNNLYVVVNNTNGYPVVFSPSILLGDNSIAKMRVSRMYPRKGRIVFVHDKELGGTLRDIRLEVEETAIFRMKLKKPIEFAGSVDEVTYYGDRVVVPIGLGDENIIRIDSLNLNRKPLAARMNVALARQGGFASNPTVSFNGHSVEIPLAETKGVSEYFGRVSANIPPALLKKENNTVIRFDTGGGYIASVTLTVVYEKKKLVR